MRVCPSCGAKAPGQAPFCNDCGEPLLGPAEPEGGSPREDQEPSSPASASPDRAPETEPLPLFLRKGQGKTEPAAAPTQAAPVVHEAPAAGSSFGQSAAQVSTPPSASAGRSGSGLLVGVIAGVLLAGVIGFGIWAAYSAGQANSRLPRPESEISPVTGNISDPLPVSSGAENGSQTPTPTEPAPAPSVEEKAEASIASFRLESLKVAPGSFLEAKLLVDVDGAEKAEILGSKGVSLWTASISSSGPQKIDQAVSVRISRETDLRLEVRGSDGQMKSQSVSVKIEPTTELCLLLRSESFIDSLMELGDGSLDAGDSRAMLLMAPMRVRDLWISKNTFFAFYGLVFSNSELSEFFGSQPWYSGYSSDADRIIKSQMGAVERRNCVLMARLHDYLHKQNSVSNETSLSDIDSTLFGQAIQYAMQAPD